MFAKYFSVAEANACVPELERIVKHLQALLAEIEEKLWQLREAKEEVRRRGEPVDAGTFMQPEAELDFLKLTAQAQIGRIREMGAILQDIHSGLVDFPIQYGGEDYLLCWRLGEPEIQYMHRPEDGFTGRRALPPEIRPHGESGTDDGPEPGGDPGGGPGGTVH